jgi:hypothetical protein
LAVSTVFNIRRFTQPYKDGLIDIRLETGNRIESFAI